MAKSDGSSILGHLRWLLSAKQHADHFDGQLLDRFLQDRDETAFAALMRRHGRLVLSVCKRVLGNVQDAEDVYQATFVVLARKAGSIRRCDAIGSWLYKTAYRLAHRARKRIHQRRSAEMQTAFLPADDSRNDVSLREVREILDEELTRLPDKYRAPLLLCYFEGRTRDEVASQLGLQLSTLKARLAKARELLRSRLARRGLPFGTALITTLLSNEYALSHVPSHVAQAAWQAATSLDTPVAALVSKSVAIIINGATRKMAAIKMLKFASAMVMVLVVAGAGMGLVMGRPSPESNGPDPTLEANAPEFPKVVQDKKPVPQPGLDPLGDPLPAGALMRLGTQRWRHGQAIVCVAWSPDGRLIASTGGENDNCVRLWDANTGKEISQFLGHKSGGRIATFTADGKFAVSNDKQGMLCVWETASGKSVSQRLMAANPGMSCLLALVGDGKTLVALDEKSKLCVLDTQTLKTVRSLAAGGPPPVCLALSKDGKLLASADSFLKIRLFELETGKLIYTTEHPGQIECLAFAPDGKSLASGGRDRTIVLWDTAVGKKKLELPGLDAAVRAVTFLPDGKRLLSGGEDGIVRLWDVDKGVQVRHFPENRFGLLSVATSPEGKRLAAAGGGHKVRIWEVDTGKELFADDGHTNYMVAIAVLGDGKTILTAGADDFVRLWDHRSGECTSQILAPHSFRIHEPRSFPKAIAVAADRKMFAAGADDGTIRLFALPDGKLIRQFKKDIGPVHAFAFSPAGKWLVCYGNSGKTWLWDVARGEAIRELHPPEELESLAFASDSRLLWMGTMTGKLLVWDTALDRDVGRVQAHKSSVQDIAASPDGKLVASISKDHTLRVFDTASAAEIRRFSIPIGINAPLAFSPDGRVVATGERLGPIRLCELASGQIRATFLGHRGSVAAMAFLPDGRSLVSGGADMTSLVWDLTGNRSGQQKATKVLTEAELEFEWKTLHGNNAQQAYESLLKLARQPTQALAKLRTELVPTEPVSAQTITQWISDLDDKQFAKREKALEGLKNAADLAWPALKKLLENPPSLETQTRARQLLGNQDDLLLPNPQRLGLLRCLELLERLNTPEAHAFVESLAKGAPEAWLTRESNLMLTRISAGK